MHFQGAAPGVTLTLIMSNPISVEVVAFEVLALYPPTTTAPRREARGEDANAAAHEGAEDEAPAPRPAMQPATQPAP